LDATATRLGVTAPPVTNPSTARAEIDLAAFRANLAALQAHVGSAALMVVVKADGYGHGMIPCAREARAAGAAWLGVATPAEALALRDAGDTGPVLAWLYGVEDDLSPLVAASVDVSAHSVDHVSRLAAAAATAERRARVHLKVDTGLSRNGAAAEVWPEVCAAAAEAENAGALEVVGIWSHFAAADVVDHPSVPIQLAAFQRAYEVARSAGLEPTLRHLSNSAGALLVPEARLDLVRVGIAAYGIDPAPGVADLAGVTLRPVMTLRSQLVNVKRIAAGAGVSYGWTWTADRPTTVGLVPLGYGDGIPRHAGNRAEVWSRGGRAPIRGRVCMDQFVVDLGPGAAPIPGGTPPDPPDAEARPGGEVILFGPGDRGEPTAEDWAEWSGTIGYEIVTRIAPRVPRLYRNATERGD
jgi:alanine racemase